MPRIDQFFKSTASPRTGTHKRPREDSVVNEVNEDEDALFLAQLEEAKRASLLNDSTVQDAGLKDYQELDVINDLGNDQNSNGKKAPEDLPATANKRLKEDIPVETSKKISYSSHHSYPFPLSILEFDLIKGKSGAPPTKIVKYGDLDLLCCRPLFDKTTSSVLFKHLLLSLPWYRVQYQAHGTTIHTPRFTTVFGLDETARFTSIQPREPDPHALPAAGDSILLFPSGIRPDKGTYRTEPRPIPHTLQSLLDLISDLVREHPSQDKASQTSNLPPNQDQFHLPSSRPIFNFCLVNLYETGQDSISPHSDDEAFLGPEPCIASLSLGGSREFILQHKSTHPKYKAKVRPPPSFEGRPGAQVAPEKFTLHSGDLIVMRGLTQAHWLHSIPKSKSSSVRPRMNITLRKAINSKGSNNYSHYNIGNGPVHRWVEDGAYGGRMVPSQEG